MAGKRKDPAHSGGDITMEMKKKKFIIYLAAAFIGGCLVTGGAAALINNGLFGSVRVNADDYSVLMDTYERYGKAEQLYMTLEENYYKDIDEDDVMTGLYKGMVEGLGDPYSSYMTEDEYASWEASTTGEYSGVGITFTQDKDGSFVVVSVEKNAPAHKGGIKAGDVIIEVNGKAYEDMDVMANAMRGKEGTDVDVTYVRDGSKKTVTLTREKIEQTTVEWEMLNEDTGYISISSFMSGTADEFSDALKAVEDRGAGSLVLDLRDNGGGLVDSCIEIADQFLDKGIVTYLENKDGKRVDYESEDGKTDLETVVLVNENSASALEILAAALQDNGIKLVGETTYGKGVVQSTVKLSDGTALKLTIMQYFSPEGRTINGKGVKPDYSVDGSEDGDPQLEKALSLLS